jgi:HEAT repeat protein
MSVLIEMLSVGDPRSDGLAGEVGEIVRKNLDLVPEPMAALEAPAAVVRGHAADALEKIARSSPRALLPFLDPLARQALTDEVPMVRWHLAMILGHLPINRTSIPL